MTLEELTDRARLRLIGGKPRDIGDLESLAAELALTNACLERHEGETSQAFALHADALQALLLQVAWIARRQWLSLAAHGLTLAALGWLVLR